MGPCESDMDVCRSKAGTYLGVEWEMCPVRCLLRDTRLQVVLQLDAASKVTALSGWPDDYAAWVVSTLGELRAVRAGRRAHEEVQDGR